jgi:inosine-uridine nucleoside N-ribohydrolase
MSSSVDAKREGQAAAPHMSGASYPLEVARRAMAERAAPAPLDDPWFIEEPELDAAPRDPAYDAWVTRMESYPPPPRAARLANSLAALYLL